VVDRRTSRIVAGERSPGRRLLEREPELAEVGRVLSQGGVLVVEAGAGVGKTALIDEACHRAAGSGRMVLRARGSELESGFAFGVVRQLFERRLSVASADERAVLLSGTAPAVGALFLDASAPEAVGDTSFAMLHGLYWLAANLAGRTPLLIAVDDAHWADESSLHWLSYLAARVEGLPLALLVTQRPGEPASVDPPLLAVRSVAGAVVRPTLLTPTAVTTLVRDALGPGVSVDLCSAAHEASGGNPFYLGELLRSLQFDGGGDEVDPGSLVLREPRDVARHVLARVRRLDPRALRLAQAVAVLGDDAELAHAARLAEVEVASARRIASGLVRLELLGADVPPRFIHPIVRQAVEASMSGEERETAHRAAARLLAEHGAPAGRVAAHLERLRPAGDAEVTGHLRTAARLALESGSAAAATRLLRRALSEPPPPADRLAVLREAARAEWHAGHPTARLHLEEALRLASDARMRAEIALELGIVHNGGFRWTEAVDVLERAVDEFGGRDDPLTARLEGELVASGLHDARTAARVLPRLEQLIARRVEGATAEAVATSEGIVALLTGQPAALAAISLEQALARATPRAENWERRAALLYVLVAMERYTAVEAALPAMLDEAARLGSSSGLIATQCCLGLLRLRLGALPEADAAARVALVVARDGDFQPGLPFAATLLAEIAVEAGELEEAQALLDLLPPRDWPAGVATALIPAVRGRLRLAQGRAAEALADFETCLDLWSPDLWAMEMRDSGYLLAHAGAAEALLLLGDRERARAHAEAGLCDMRRFGAPRALGIALRVSGLAREDTGSLERLRESVAVLRASPALLERARSLAALGTALRRSGSRSAAREPLTEALDLGARCGARPLIAQLREELRVAGARPRRNWQIGVESLTPSELRVVRLAAEGRTNRQIAQSLYLSLKTVETHLARAYAKLGVGGRAELSGVLPLSTTGC
jgi:DNA-binding CsgD family transcriptional regulator/predicted negative regulator of RcsB-dependent stress response